MSSLTDETAAQAIRTAPQTLQYAGNAIKAGKSGGKKVVKGIGIVLKAPVFTTKLAIKAVRKFLHMVSSDVKFSYSNISIKKLQREGNISVLNEAIAKEIMKPFDKICRKNRIKYKVMYDKDKEEYTLFFSGRDTEVINACLKKATDNWIKAQAKAMENQQNPLGKVKESIRSKLTFFRDWAKKHNENRKKVNDKNKDDKDL